MYQNPDITLIFSTTDISYSSGPSSKLDTTRPFDVTLSSLNSSRFNVLGSTTEATIVEEPVKSRPTGIFKPFGDTLSTPTKSPVKFQHLIKEPSLRLKLTSALTQQENSGAVMIAVSDLLKESIKVSFSIKKNYEKFSKIFPRNFAKMPLFRARSKYQSKLQQRKRQSTHL